MYDYTNQDIAEVFHKKVNRNDDTLLQLNKNKKCKIQYEYMLYVDYYNNIFYFTNYKMLDTSDNIDKVISGIQNILIRALENKFNINLMVYQVNDVDLCSISYNIIKSYNFPWCNIKISGKDIKICSFYGDKNLYKNIYQHFDLLNDYDKYIKDIDSLNVKTIEDIYEQIFNKKAKFIFKKRSKMLKQLIKQKKIELIEIYKQ